MSLFESKNKYEKVIREAFPRGAHICSLYPVLVNREYRKDDGSGVQVSAEIAVFLDKGDTETVQGRDLSSSVHRFIRVFRVPSSRVEEAETVKGLYPFVEHDIVKSALIESGADEKALEDAQRYFIGGDAT